MRLLYFIAAALLVQVEAALAWGQEGHWIVAEIAARRLVPRAKEVARKGPSKGSKE
ncbi:hypothetical protein [Bradyrhizobium sp. CCBAU 051011]|uniref:hypothetical protein n=1 Tax=Bradyrhizobium sp. CCBAU 051011 TaxID=858422 RepID=UPI00137991D5|nr:hypothetical protein [Bradyrhizobium sp. CCBAU 051011]